MSLSLRSILLALPAATLAVFSACDNVGRAFDPDITPPGGPGQGGGTSDIQVPAERGDVREGRPLVREAYPKGGGWPTTVPIVVEFSESLNEQSMLPTTEGGTDGRVIVRVEGTGVAIPAAYEFLAQGRLLIIRPPTGLSNDGEPVYEVVLLPGGRDADGVRFRSSEEEVLATFTVDADEGEVDGEILALYPRDNQAKVARETDVIAVFTRPADGMTLNATNFDLRTELGAAITGDPTTPLRTLGIPDSRVVRLRPGTSLDASTRHELTVSAAITFPNGGGLEFNGAVPFSVFTTGGVPAPLDVRVGNPTAGFADKINRANIDVLQMEVEVPSDAAAGDRIVARVYGGDREEVQNTAALLFAERTAEVPMAGAQTVTLSFAGEVGTLARPLFDEGELTFAAQLQRGDAHSGIIHGDSDAALDTVVPEVSSVGPPVAAGGMNVITDLAHLAFYGTADERVGAATLTDGMSTVELFASQGDGTFLMKPLLLGVLTAPRSYSLTIVDNAGNMAAAPFTGNILQRGQITGAVDTSITVEVYDHATLQPLAGATVVVDTPGRTSDTTGADGRVVISGLPATNKTVTVLMPGYDIVTLFDTGVSHASLPLQPTGGATAELTGVAFFESTPGLVALVGSGAIADPTVLAVAADAASPSTIPPIEVLPNRPTVVSAIGAALEPVTTPSFAFHGCNICGLDLLTPTPPAAGVAAGEELEVNLAMPPAVSPALASLGAPINEDFGNALGLDTANLVGNPIVRFTMSLLGFPGQTLLGVGFSANTGGAMFDLTGSFSQALLAPTVDFMPTPFLLSEARDTGGRISRLRALVVPGTPVMITDPLNPQPIPSVTGPVGTVPAPPTAMVVDALNPAGLLGILEITATDPGGRKWTIFAEDMDGSGTTDPYPFPDMTGLAALDLGEWSVHAEARLFLDFTGMPGSFVLAERMRTEATYSRSAPLTFTVQ